MKTKKLKKQLIAPLILTICISIFLGFSFLISFMNKGSQSDSTSLDQFSQTSPDTPSSSPSPKPEDECFAKACEFLKVKDYEGAIAAYEDAIKIGKEKDFADIEELVMLYGI